MISYKTYKRSFMKFAKESFRSPGGRLSDKGKFMVSSIENLFLRDVEHHMELVLIVETNTKCNAYVTDGCMKRKIIKIKNKSQSVLHNNKENTIS